MRKFIGAKDGYAPQLIIELIRMIKSAKGQLGEKVMMVGNESGEDNDQKLMRGLGGCYNMMYVTSWIPSTQRLSAYNMIYVTLCIPSRQRLSAS